MNYLRMLLTLLTAKVEAIEGSFADVKSASERRT